MKLSGATVTRIEEELARLTRNSPGASRKERKGRSWGERHRAIEEFIRVLVEEIKVHDAIHERAAKCVRNFSTEIQSPYKISDEECQECCKTQ
jgi:hypothetical protein